MTDSKNTASQFAATGNDIRNACPAPTFSHYAGNDQTEEEKHRRDMYHYRPG